MFSKTFLAGGAFLAASLTTALATPMTVGGVDFDTDNAATDVLWAQGGVFAGNLDDRREACVDFTDRTSTVGANGVNCRGDEAAGFDLDQEIELDENNTVTQQPDALAVFFDEPLINGDGFDLIIFEAANQSDNPSVSIMFGGMEITGTVLDTIEIDGDNFTISAFDFSDAPLNIAMGATIGEPIFIQTFQQVGSSDIAAIIGINFGDPVDPMPEVPLPAAAPLFLAGLGGLAWSRKRKKA